MTDLVALPLVDAGQGAPVEPCRVELAWLATDTLVIDPAYQRDVRHSGKAHIGRIARGFSWSKFAPLIAAPVGDGRYAIIDGQHRAIAAKARGLTPLPALIMPIGPEAQAAAFAAINGQVTPINSMHVYKAALAAGEEWARQIWKVAAAAGVRLLTYPKPRNTIAAHETMAIAAVREGVRAHGEAVVTAALGAAAAQAKPGLLNQSVVKALIAVAAEAAAERGTARFLRAMARVDLAAEDRAAATGAIETGISRMAFLTESLRDRLREQRDAA